MLWLTRYQLRSKDVASRRKAAEQLSHKPDPKALREIFIALADEDADVRRFGAEALSKLEDAEVLQGAITELKQTPDERARVGLTPLLRHANAGVRTHAAMALEGIGWRPVTQEEQIWLAIANGQMVRAAGFGKAAIPPLESVMASSPPSLRAAAIEALGLIGAAERVLTPLLEELKSPELAVCIAAVGAVSRIGGPQVVEALAGLATHKDGQVRLAVAESLGIVEGGAAAVEPLLALLKDSLWDVRRAAAETLARFRDPRTVEALSAALSDHDADVREAVVKALAELRDRRALGRLILTLKDPVSTVRRLAAGALTRVDPDWSSLPEAAPAFEQLKSSLDESEADARHFVRELLAGVGAVEPEALPGQKGDIQRAISAKTRRHMASAIFHSLLGDADPDLRQAAAESLGRLGDRRAESALVGALGDADAGVRQAAAQALEALGHPGARG